LKKSKYEEIIAKKQLNFFFKETNKKYLEKKIELFKNNDILWLYHS